MTRDERDEAKEAVNCLIGKVIKKPDLGPQPERPMTDLEMSRYARPGEPAHEAMARYAREQRIKRKENDA